MKLEFRARRKHISVNDQHIKKLKYLLSKIQYKTDHFLINLFYNFGIQNLK